MQSATKVIVYGLGYIGRSVVESLLTENPFWNRPLELVGVVDIMPESRQWAQKKGVKAFHSLKDLLSKTKPDVCIHTTASTLAIIMAQLKELIESKTPVVTSAEGMFFPWVENAELARETDKRCKTAGVAVLGTRVNPGFVMDVLPALLTQVVHTV